MIEYTLKALLLIALMLLHDNGLHLYACIVVLAVTFPIVEAGGKGIDDMIKLHRQKLER